MIEALEQTYQEARGAGVAVERLYWLNLGMKRAAGVDPTKVLS